MDISQSSLSRYKSEKRGASASTSTSPSSTTIKSKDTSGSSEQGYNQLNAQAGQTIRGQILDLRYNEVTIRIEPGNQVITAKLSGNIPISIGQDATFQLTEGINDSLLLKYLPVDLNTATDAIILKALTASGLGTTDRNKAIVSELLDQNMPIDKQTLQSLIRQSHINHEASPSTLVLMFKNNIPMTPENIRQFEIYQNGTNKLINDIRVITGNISELLTPGKEAADTLKVITDSLPLQDNLKSTPTLNNTCSQGSTPISENGPTPMTPALNEAVTRILRMNTGLIDILYKESSTSAAETRVLSNNAEALPAPSAVDTPISDIIKSSECSKLSEYVKLLPGKSDISEEVKNGTIGLEKLLTYIKESLSDSTSSSAIQNETINHITCQGLLQSPEYSSLLEHAFLKRWTVNPDEIANKNPIQELYKNLPDDIDKLSELIRTIKDDESSLQIREPLKNLQENVSFMKDLNEMFTYLQLPVQLKDRNLHSELYVYTRKRSLKEKQDTVSVLLHLDMEHLGPLNIHIEMKQNLIRANFYTEDQDTGLLLGNQMPLLEEALSKKGYQLQTEIKSTYKEPEFVKDFIAQNLTDGSVKRYTFDIRT